MKEKKLILNYVYNMAYQILLMIMPLITSPYISRVLGAENIGIYSYTYSIVFYFGIFANLGISNYGNRAIAKCRNSQKELDYCFSSIYSLHAILSITITAIYMIYVFLFAGAYKQVATIQALYLVSILFDISWFFFGIEEFKATVGRNTVVKIATTVLIFVFVKQSSDLWIYTTILTMGTVLGNLTLWMFVKKYVHFVRPKWRDILTHLKPMAVLSISSIAVSVYLYIDKIMLGAMSSMTEVGFYENAFKMIQFPLGLITAMGTVMLPHISNLIARGHSQKVKLYIGNSMKIIALVSPAIAFGLASVSDIFSVVFWGEEFAACGPILTLLAVTAILISWNNIVRTEFLIPMELDGKYVKAVCIGALVDIILNAVAIPQLGGIGAAMGTVGAYIAVFSVQNIASKEQLSHAKYFAYHIPFCIIGFVMFAIVKFIGTYVSPNITGLIIMIAVGVIVYIILSLSYIGIAKDEFYMAYIKGAFAKIRRRIT